MSLFNPVPFKLVTEDAPKTYKAETICGNCDHQYTVDVPFGKLKRKFRLTRDCDYCGVNDWHWVTIKEGQNV